MIKKMLASQVVAVVRTFVVCAPKIFSVTPPPKAAPRPSLFGRCIRMTNIMRSANERLENEQGIDQDVHRDGQYVETGRFVKRRRPASEPATLR